MTLCKKIQLGYIWFNQPVIIFIQIQAIVSQDQLFETKRNNTEIHILTHIFLFYHKRAT